MNLSDSVSTVRGVGKKIEEKLHGLHIETVGDLLFFFPREYQDWIHPVRMDELSIGENQMVYGKIVDIKEFFPRPGLSLLTVVVSDGMGAVNLIFFNQKWKKNEFFTGMHIAAYGKVEYTYGKWQMNGPETETVSPDHLKDVQGWRPLYPLTEGIRMGQMRKLIQNALEQMGDLKENIPAPVVSQWKLMDRNESVRNMHQPQSEEMQKQARYRLAFEELFFLQAGVLTLRRRRESGKAGIKCAPSGELVNGVIRRLPFIMTEGQKQAFLDIESDMEGLRPMQRLIQGDVGSGKTAVAALALAKIVENGYQGALMVPTEVLAEQHQKTLQNLFSGLHISSALLTGRTKNSEREHILEQLRQGRIQVLIGTHALLEENVVFRTLGLVITDEQHRFGVRQRMALETKGQFPHVLVMTATPIPRTMALSVYGDLDVSMIRNLPAGRKPVQTYAVRKDILPRVYRFMKKEMDQSHQIYVVCPLVEKSEKQDLQDAVTEYEYLRTSVFPGYSCGLVHGRMKGQEKAEVMEKFRLGKIQLLVATSVIEVGINVPKATVMFVHGADRFGLSQLHQLRGRVGRGSSQSYCILYTDSKNESALLRMSLMTQIHDGFLLAEKDLMLRGSGEFFGYHQHGLPDLKVADIIRDLPILEQARKAASLCLKKGYDFTDELDRRFGRTFFEILYH
jgi:ATP-dependent DNA helicase RecG